MNLQLCISYICSLGNFPWFKFFMKTLIVTSLEQLCGILPPPTNEAHFALSTHICLIFKRSSNEWIFFCSTIVTFISHFLLCFTILCPWLSIFMTILKSNCWEILTHVSNNQCCFVLCIIVVVYFSEIDSNRHFYFISHHSIINF